jgi:hypothetical protein
MSAGLAGITLCLRALLLLLGASPLLSSHSAVAAAAAALRLVGVAAAAVAEPVVEVVTVVLVVVLAVAVTGKCVQLHIGHCDGVWFLAWQYSLQCSHNSVEIVQSVITCHLYCACVFVR